MAFACPVSSQNRRRLRAVGGFFCGKGFSAPRCHSGIFIPRPRPRMKGEKKSRRKFAAIFLSKPIPRTPLPEVKENLRPSPARNGSAFSANSATKPPPPSATSAESCAAIREDPAAFAPGHAHLMTEADMDAIARRTADLIVAEARGREPERPRQARNAGGPARSHPRSGSGSSRLQRISHQKRLKKPGGRRTSPAPKCADKTSLSRLRRRRVDFLTTGFWGTHPHRHPCRRRDLFF